jgi:Nif-specific regulatory protein
MEAQQSNNQENVLKKVINDLEMTMITSALARTRGNQAQAAKLLGTTKRKLSYRVRKYAIDPDEFRSKK